jgi:hypothetical protein
MIQSKQSLKEYIRGFTIEQLLDFLPKCILGRNFQGEDLWFELRVGVDDYDGQHGLGYMAEEVTGEKMFYTEYLPPSSYDSVEYDYEEHFISLKEDNHFTTGNIKNKLKELCYWCLHHGFINRTSSGFCLDITKARSKF